MGPAAPGREPVERVAVKDCLDVLGAGAGAALPSCGPSPSVSIDSASVGSSEGPLVPVSPPSDAFVGAVCRREGRLDNPGAVVGAVLRDPGLDVLVVGSTIEGREAREVAD